MLPLWLPKLWSRQSKRWGKNMLFRTIVSAFFLESSCRDDLATLLKRIAMADVAPFDQLTRGALGIHEPDRELLGGTWGGFKKTWAIIDDVEQYRCLQLYSSAARYTDAMYQKGEQRNAQEDDPLLAYVHTFRDACLALNPRAAFLDAGAHYEDESWDNKLGSRTFTLEQAPLVAAGDADALAGQFFSLLYLDTRMLANWSQESAELDRDVIELPRGKLIFAGSGPTRMA